MAKFMLGYTRPFPAAPLIPRGSEGFVNANIDDYDEFCRIIDGSPDARAISVDTETSSLSPIHGDVVSFSFSFDGVHNYNVPINHVDPSWNIPNKADVLRRFHARLLSAPMVLFYNARFDIRFIEFEGRKLDRALFDATPNHLKYRIPTEFSLSKLKVHDVAVDSFLSDTNMPSNRRSLEKDSLFFLGIQQPSFKDTLGDATNYAYLNPSLTYEYPCFDAGCTFRLGQAVYKYFKDNGKSAENMQSMLIPLMRAEDGYMEVDLNMLRVHYSLVEDDLAMAMAKVREFTDINVGSSVVLGNYLLSHGFNVTKFTPKGRPSVDKASLADMALSDSTGFIKALGGLGKLKTELSSLKTMLTEATANNGFIRIAYHDLRVPTLRLSSGSDDGDL